MRPAKVQGETEPPNRPAALGELPSSRFRHSAAGRVVALARTKQRIKQGQHFSRHNKTNTFFDYRCFGEQSQCTLALTAESDAGMPELA